MLLTPTSDVPSAGVARLTDLAAALGSSPRDARARGVRWCNVVLLVPLAVLGSLALPRWSWQDWTAWGFLLAGAVELDRRGWCCPHGTRRTPTLVANTLGALLGAWLVVAVRFLTVARTRDLESWTRCPQCGTRVRGSACGPLHCRRMSTTWLTKRRAVDHCRVRSSLCRMS